MLDAIILLLGLAIVLAPDSRSHVQKERIYKVANRSLSEGISDYEV